MPQASYHFIDPMVLFDAVDADLALFRTLSHTYLETAAPVFSRLEQALRRGDRQAVMHQCHTLRGTTSLVGARQLTSLLAELEQRARGTGPAPGPDDLGDLTDSAGLARLFALVEQEVRLSIGTFHGAAPAGPA